MGAAYPVTRVVPRYRELNIMNRVLTKDFSTESFSNSEPCAFSGVFRPASRMQSVVVSEEGVGPSIGLDPYKRYTLIHIPAFPANGESDEEW